MPNFANTTQKQAKADKGALRRNSPEIRRAAKPDYILAVGYQQIHLSEPARWIQSPLFVLIPKQSIYGDLQEGTGGA